MIVCPRCGEENAAGARFCSACGSPLEQAAAPAREERKVVTVLFADLVGFPRGPSSSTPRTRYLRESEELLAASA